MSVFNEFVMAYRDETTAGTRNPDPFTTTTQLYKFGVIDDKVTLPAGVNEAIIYWTADKKDPYGIEYGKMKPEGTFSYSVRHGVPYYWALGSCTTSGTGPYTHTITGTNGPSLPTFTVHQESKVSGGTSNIYMDTTGCTVQRLETYIQQDNPLGMVHVLRYIGMRNIGADATTNPAIDISSTTAPAFPTGTNDSPFYFDSSATLTWASTSYLTKLFSFYFSIENMLRPVYTHTTSTDNYGNNASKWPSSIVLQERRLAVVLTLLQTDRTFLEDLLNAAKKSLTVTVQRAVDDYITFTFESNQALITKNEITQPKVGEVPLRIVSIMPKSVTITVSDQIPASFYGG